MTTGSSTREFGNAVCITSNQGTPYEVVPDLVRDALRRNAYNYSIAYDFPLEAVEYIVGPMTESLKAKRTVLDQQGTVVDVEYEEIGGQWDHLFMWRYVGPAKD